MAALHCPHCKAPLLTALDRCPQCGGAIPSSTTQIQAPDSRPVASPRPARESIKEPATTLRSARPTRHESGTSEVFREEMARFTGAAVPNVSAIGAAPIPPQGYRAAEELGSPLASFDRPADPNRAGLIGGIVLIVLGLAFLIPLVLPPSPRNQRAEEERFWVFLIYSGPLIIGGILLVLLRKQTPSQTYWVCPLGLMWRWGDQVEYRRWEEIERFSSSVVAGRAVYWLSPRRGLNLVLRSSMGHAVILLAEYIELRASAAFLPVVLDCIDRGRRAAFGKLTMDAEGLHAGWRTCRWEEFAGMHVDAGELRVDRHGQRGHIRLRALDVSFPMVAQAAARIIVEDGLAA